MLLYKDISNKDPYASDENTVARQAVKVWGTAHEFEGSVADRVTSKRNKNNYYY